MNHGGARRESPALWDTDWLVLRGLARALDGMLGVVGHRGRVLDFGCGAMPYRGLVERHGLSYQGADFSPDADVMLSPDGQLPDNMPKVDVVLSMQVLEHVRDLDLYFAQIGRVLEDDGTLLLSTHGTWLYHPHPQDHRRWTRTGLAHDIEASGFAVHDIISIVGPLATTTLIRLTSFAWVLRKLPLLGGVLAKLLAIVMNLRAWIEDKVTPRSVSDVNGCVYLVRCSKVAGR